MKEFHPIAELFPLMEGANFNELVASVKKNGLRQAITLYEDKILDGRNRERACKQAGVEPHYEELPPDKDPYAFVADANLTRRHLSKSQCAVIAEKMATMKNGGDRKSNHSANSNSDLKSRNEAAKIMKVGKTSLNCARRARKQGIPEVIEAMEKDRIPTYIADNIAALPKDKQAAALEDRLKGIKNPALSKKTKPTVNGKKPLTRAELNRRRWEADTLPLRCLTPEQVDPELAKKSWEFTAKYGFLPSQTKEEFDADRDAGAFHEWLRIAKRLRSELRVLVKIAPFSNANLVRWINRCRDQEGLAKRHAEMEEMLTLFKQAAELVAPHIEWLPSQKPS